MTPKQEPKLTQKQEMFIQEYLKDLNATQAAIRAGYSQKTAKVIGTENLTKPSIKNKIKDLMQKRADITDIQAEKVLREIARMAFSDITEIMSWDSEGKLTIKASDELTKNQTASIKKITQKTRYFGDSKETELTVELYDKQKSLDMLCKHLGLYDKNLNGDVEAVKDFFKSLADKKNVGDLYSTHKEE